MVKSMKPLFVTIALLLLAGLHAAPPLNILFFTADDMSNDPNERVNLIAEPARQAEIEAMRQGLLALMQRTGDPFAEALAHRDHKELVPTLIKNLKVEYSGRVEAE